MNKMKFANTTTEWLQKEIEEQKKWIEDRGGCLAGYVCRYGSVNDFDHYGNGGEAIYEADSNYLKELEIALTTKQTQTSEKSSKNTIKLQNNMPLAVGYLSAGDQFTTKGALTVWTVHFNLAHQYEGEKHIIAEHLRSCGGRNNDVLSLTKDRTVSRWTFDRIVYPYVKD